MNLLSAMGVAHQSLLHSQDDIFVIPMFVPPNYGANDVLGVQWLETLNHLVSDYTIPLLEFTHNARTITLTCINSATHTSTSFNQIFQFVFIDTIHFSHVISLHQLDNSTILETHKKYIIVNLFPITLN